MTSFQWQEAWGVGDATLDGTHKVFITLLNHTIAANEETFETAFWSLIEQTREHFSYEEQQLSLLGVASAKAHRIEHRVILAEMDGYRMKALNGQTDLVHHYLTQLLPTRFRKHTKTMDLELARHI